MKKTCNFLQFATVAFRGDVWWASAGYGPWEVGGFRLPIRLLGLWSPSSALSFSVYPGLPLVSVFLVASSGCGIIKRLRHGGLRFKVRLSRVLLRMLLHPGFRCWVHGSGFHREQVVQMRFMLFMKKSSALLALLRRSLQEPRLVLAH